MDFSEMNNVTFIDSDTPYRKSFSSFDTDGFQRIKPSSRCVTVCLGVLCAVLLAANIGQLIYHGAHPADNTERDLLQRRLTNLTAERDLLQQRYNAQTISKNDLQTSCKSLQADKDQLQILYNDMEKDQEKLHIHLISLTIDCLEIAREFTNKMLKSAVQVRSMPCQTGWLKFGDSCYIVSALKKNWTSSRESCHGAGAELVVINNRDEQAFVNGLLAAGQNAWIGLTDSIKEGTWMWLDGTPVNTTYWGTGQPNSYGGSQDCGEIVQQDLGVGYWNDDGCSGDQSFVCEQ